MGLSAFNAMRARMKAEAKALVKTSADVEVKEIHYEKKYSQDEICEDAQKEVFDMEKNSTGVYKHLDSGGFF